MLQEGVSNLNETQAVSCDNKTKILLITGFLGSGKTTLLKNILSWETDLSDTVVIVNELGKVGIDGALLQKSGSDVIELTSGCICCTMKLGLIDTLKDVWQRFHPKRILLEATGVAEPNSVASVLQDEALKRVMEIQSIITVLDIRFWKARDRLGTFFTNQLEQANLILLNKVDTAEKAAVPKALKKIRQAFPGSRTVPTTFCEVDPEILWVGDHGKTTGEELFEFYRPILASRAAQEKYSPHSTHDELPLSHNEANGFVTFSFRESKPFDERCFERFLEQVDWELFRIKGLVRFPDRTVLLNFAGGRGESEPWDGDQGTSLAFVGWRVVEVEVIEQLKRCLMPE
jgi:G3E family GTPase